MVTSMSFLSQKETDLRRSWFPRGPGTSLECGHLERGQLAVLIALVVLTVGAWALTIHQAQTMDMPMGVVARGAAAAPDRPTAADDMDDMGGMAMDEAADMAATGMAGAGWSLAGLAAFVVAWAVMMAAMMFPAAAPMLLLFRTVATQRQASGEAFVPTWVFVAGYLLVWTAVGALTWVLVQGLSDLAGRLGAAERATWAPLALGAVLIGAGLYQLTPLKQVCLDHCRSPLAFVMQHWRDGLRRGAADGAGPWRLLPGLLLGALRGAGGGRGHEPGLDAAADAGRLRREGAAGRAARLPGRRHRLRDLGAR